VLPALSCACTNGGIPASPRLSRVEPCRSREEGGQGEARNVTRGGLIRETAYLYEDEEKALEEQARRSRCSKAEIVRRALRAYLRLDPAG
jgi:hypothetical protein